MPLPLLILLLISCSSPYSARGTAPESQGASDFGKDTELSSLAERTVNAIRDKDAPFLSANVDDNGVFVGTDSNRMSAAEFRRQLDQRNGVYCVIFDASCLSHGSGGRGQSLRGLVVGSQKALLDVRDVNGAARTKAVTVRKDRDSPKILFRLIYRYNGKTWKLQQFEYE